MRFGYFFRKSPFFRACCILLIFSAAGIGVFLVSFRSYRLPEIDRIEPAVALPGDILTIYGSSFGEERGAGYVEIGGSRVTSSSYLSWGDSLIRLKIPANVQDGFVYVSTEIGRSGGKIFANGSGIPQAAVSDRQTGLPVITSLSNTIVSPGAALSIYGSNFGSVRNGGGVFFTARRESATDNAPAEFIPCSDSDYDYEFWSDTEIRVRIPDGAASGNMYVATVKGRSNYQRCTVAAQGGTKTFSHKRTYLVQVSVDIANAVSAGDASLTLRLPRPALSSHQPVVEMTDCSPEPVLSDYQRTVVQQISLDAAGNRKKVFTQNFAVTVYAVSADVRPRQIKQTYDTNRVLYQASLQADRCIQSDDPRIRRFVEETVGNETNPYSKAEKIYSYFMDNFTVTQELRKGDASVFDLLLTNQGDAYDFAVLFCTAVRAAGVPARPVSGILIDFDLVSKSHWWCEFYVDGLGWIPVDPALGAGLPFSVYEPIADKRGYYFGSVDSQRIAFSHGWNEIKPASASSKIVYRPRTYALQSIWEESTAQAQGYSSFWGEPQILGLY